MAEGRKFDLPSAMTDEEIERLGVLMSEVDRAVQPKLPQSRTHGLHLRRSTHELLHIYH
jgi:hypothetical protein